MSSGDFFRVCEAVPSFQRLRNRGIGICNLSVLGCLWFLGTDLGTVVYRITLIRTVAF